MPSQLECFTEMSPIKVNRQINQEKFYQKDPKKDRPVEEIRDMCTNSGFQVHQNFEDYNLKVNENFEELKKRDSNEEEEEEEQDSEEDELLEEDDAAGEYEEAEEEDQAEGSSDSDQSADETEEEDQFEPETEQDETMTHEQITPFWFAHEDADHIKVIFRSYSNHVNIEDTPIELIDRRCSSPLFVGSVKRTTVRNCGDFMTLDEVRIYKKLAIPPGVPLPIDHKILLLTSWNEEGLPWQMSLVTPPMKTFWSQRALDVSYLIRFPSRSRRDEDVFMVAQADIEVSYRQNNCRTTLCYEPYLTDFKNDSYFLKHLPYQLDNIQLELCPY